MIILDENRNYLLSPASQEERLWAAAAHLLTFLPSVGWLAPLVVYFIKREQSGYVSRHALESLNFQITLIIAYAVSALLCLVCIGFFLMGIVWLLSIVSAIIATIKAYDGQDYKYPFCIRLI